MQHGSPLIIFVWDRNVAMRNYISIYNNVKFYFIESRSEMLIVILLFAHCLLFICLMIFAYCQLLFANCLFLNANCYLLIAFCLLLFAICQLLFAYC